MIKILLIIAAILILVIFLLGYRTHTLFSVLRGSFRKRVDKFNKVNAIMFPIIMVAGMGLLFWTYGDFSLKFLPESASEHGLVTDNLFWGTTVVTVIAWLFLNILLFVFPYLYQHKEGTRAYFFPDHHKLEIFWTVVTTIMIVIMAFYGLKTWAKVMMDPPEDPVIVEIMGKQFAWKVRYPGPDGKLGKYDFRLIDETNESGIDFTDKASLDDFSPREIHIPKGKPVMFKIRSRDVLHSVYAPHFRVKMDAVPGMPTRFYFTPRTTTEEMRDNLNDPDFKYELACAELCGKGHFAMRYLIYVDEEEDYYKWLSEQKSWLSKHPEYLEKVPENLRQFVKDVESLPDEALALEKAKGDDSENEEE